MKEDKDLLYPLKGEAQYMERENSMGRKIQEEKIMKDKHFETFIK
jgi:hypothetical protein